MMGLLCGGKKGNPTEGKQGKNGTLTFYSSMLCAARLEERKLVSG